MSSENSKLPAEKTEHVLKYDKAGFPLDNPALKGLTRYFNNCTIRGRANVAKATIAGFFAIYLYSKFRSSDRDMSK